MTLGILLNIPEFQDFETEIPSFSITVRIQMDNVRKTPRTYYVVYNKQC